MLWATDAYSEDSASEFTRNGNFNASIILDEKIVGVVGFHNLNLKNKSAHIGYWLAKEAQGKGIMTRCCHTLFDYLFDDFGLNRLQINCNVENTKSRAIPERLGFQLEGVPRPIGWLHDRFGDWAVYAMLQEDWANVKSGI